MKQYLDKSYKDLYIEVYQQSKIVEFRKGMLAGHFLTRDIGRFCSVWFIKHSIVPNQITLLMIIFGIIGSIFFALPYTWCKILGYICWLMWFAMDCSDGQVARYTKTYSIYGTEMDYMAHLLDHSCMNIAILITFLQMNVINPIFLCFIFILNISVELMLRNIIAFDYFHNKIHKNTTKIERVIVSIPKYLITESILYPTMIICFSWIIIVGYSFSINWILYLYILWLVCYITLSLKSIIKHLIKYCKSLT